MPGSVASLLSVLLVQIALVISVTPLSCDSAAGVDHRSCSSEVCGSKNSIHGAVWLATQLAMGCTAGVSGAATHCTGL